jgi:DNA-binding LacI/PurR family transcriptional regulator
MTKIKGNRPTIHDVAREAGVSAQTVSRAINNQPRISAETREHVLKAAKRLNYRPNKTARALVTQRSHTIEVITTHPAHSLFLSSLASMSKFIRAAGYQVTLSVTDPEHFRKRLRSATAQLTDGVILIVPNHDLRMPADELLELCAGVPFVQTAADLGVNSSSVVYDQGYGAGLAVQHLIDLGHRRIAEISGDPRMFDTQLRHDAWLNTLQKNNIEPGPTTGGKFTVEGGYDAAKELLKKQFPFTAIFAGNDRMAIGAMYAVNEYGLRVPEDISIVGYDDIEYSPYTHPPLTTVAQDFKQLGKMAAEYLLTLIENPETPIHQRILLPKLIIRQSTQAPSSSR